MKSDELIEALAKDGKPVHPLRSPLVRMVTWMACAAPVVGVITIAMGLRPDLPELLVDARWVAEQGFALMTALFAGLAAFHLSVPGHNARWVALPIVSALGWLLLLGAGCVRDISQSGMAAISLVPEPECLFLISLIGLAPAAILLRMVFQGVPIFPARTLFAAALAAAALGAFGLRLVHDQDLGIMVLVWQFGSVALVAAIGWIAGPFILRWPKPGWSKQ